MKNAPCTLLSWAEELELMNAFPKYLEDSEENLARQFFQQIVFFETVEKGVRRCICTSCMEGFYAYKETSPAFFKVTHGKRCECPNCGQAATLAAIGKFKNFESLSSHERGIQISKYKDWLLVQAGYIIRRFDDEDLGGCIDFMPFRRYAFAPGRRFMWRKYASSWFGQWWTSENWERADYIKEPFAARPYEREASYIPMGVENLAGSSMRYCQYGEWFDKEYGGYLGGLDWDVEPFRVAYMIQYLSEYTRRPQMEMLVKLNYHQVVSDLVIRGKPSADILDWKAKDPASFFRLSKSDFRLFQYGYGSYGELKYYRRLHRAGLIRDLQQFVMEKADCGVDFQKICESCLLANVSMERGKNYLRFFDGREGLTLETAPQFWLDYLTAAKLLKYDLKRDDVRMPKNLLERHNDAMNTAAIQKDAKLMKKYSFRFVALAAQFEFSEDGLMIVVPRCPGDIITEGKSLHHCVGGYADRHMRGEVTILFLRKKKNPIAPYVTIEMSTENNCKDLRIVQIHGFENDLGRDSPRKTHAEFLQRWMDWIHSGSPRKADGMPIVPEKQSVSENGVA